MALKLLLLLIIGRLLALSLVILVGSWGSLCTSWLLLNLLLRLHGTKALSGVGHLLLLVSAARFAHERLHIAAARLLKLLTCLLLLPLGIGLVLGWK